MYRELSLVNGKWKFGRAIWDRGPGWTRGVDVVQFARRGVGTLLSKLFLSYLKPCGWDRRDVSQNPATHAWGGNSRCALQWPWHTFTVTLTAVKGGQGQAVPMLSDMWTGLVGAPIQPGPGMIRSSRSTNTTAVAAAGASWLGQRERRHPTEHGRRHVLRWSEQRRGAAAAAGGQRMRSRLVEVRKVGNLGKVPIREKLSLHTDFSVYRKRSSKSGRGCIERVNSLSSFYHH